MSIAARLTLTLLLLFALNIVMQYAIVSRARQLNDFERARLLGTFSWLGNVAFWLLAGAVVSAIVWIFQL